MVEYSDDNRGSNISAKTVAATTVGVVVAGGTSTVTSYALNSKLLPFDTAVAEETVKEIKSMGLSGGLTAAGGAATDGMQFAGGAIKEKVYLSMLKENKLARALHNLGGRGVISTAVAVVTGIAAFGVTLMAFGSRKREGDNYTTAQLEQRGDDMVEATRQLAAARANPVRQQEIITEWQKKIDAQKAQAAAQNTPPSRA